MNLPVPPTRPIQIAGHRHGKHVYIHGELADAYGRLQAAAKKQNYWAHVALQGLHALQTGIIGKDNIFVKDAGFPRGLQQLKILLPGLAVFAERTTDDRYTVVRLELNADYFDPDEARKTGIHRVTKESTRTSTSRWGTAYVEDGKVLHEKSRAVAIADTGRDNAPDAAADCARRLTAAPGVTSMDLARDGFDMHFTAGRDKLGGWTRYTALHSPIEGTYQSAFLLADAMQNAREIVGVRWVSIYGGSMILTQAMKILVDRGVTLNGHTAFLCNPRTSPNPAVRLAHKLQLTLNEDFSETGFSPIGALSSARAVKTRIRDKNDAYGWQHSLADGSSGVLKTLSVLGAGAFAVGLAGPPRPGPVRNCRSNRFRLHSGIRCGKHRQTRERIIRCQSAQIVHQEMKPSC